MSHTDKTVGKKTLFISCIKKEKPKATSGKAGVEVEMTAVH